MLLTTTDTVPENLYVIERILGPVHGETIFGTHFGKDFLASFTNAFGGRSGTYENELTEARAKAEEELIERASKMGANAIIGLKYNLSVFGEGGAMFLAAISGTAVQIREK